jgi:hypothetical protein
MNGHDSGNETVIAEILNAERPLTKPQIAQLQQHSLTLEGQP